MKKKITFLCFVFTLSSFARVSKLELIKEVTLVNAESFGYPYSASFAFVKGEDPTENLNAETFVMGACNLIIRSTNQIVEPGVFEIVKDETTRPRLTLRLTDTSQWSRIIFSESNNTLVDIKCFEGFGEQSSFWARPFGNKKIAKILSGYIKLNK